MNTNMDLLEISEVAREMELKKVKRGIVLFWICLICLVVGIVGAVKLHGKMRNQNLQGIKKVQVRVVDVVEKRIRINGNINTSYEVTVTYMGEEYELINGGHSPWTYVGHKGTAYMYENKIYANEEGPASGTIVGKLYFVFLISSFVLFIVTPSLGASVLQRRKRVLGK